MYDKEDVYDNEISPLVKQIIDICKREQLPMVSQFYLKEKGEDGEPMFCTTVIIPEKREMNPEAHGHLSYVDEAMKYGVNGKPFFMAATITKL